MAANLEDFIRLLDSWGIYEVLLPFILIFAIVFGILSKVNILGKHKNINAMFALAISLTVVIVHEVGMVPADRDAVVIINKMIPNFGLLIVGIMSFLILIAMFGGEVRKSQPGVFAFVIIFTVLFNIFFNETYPTLAPLLLWITIIATIILVLRPKKQTNRAELIPGWIVVFITGLIFWWIISAMELTKWPSWLEWARNDTTHMIISSSLIMLAVIYFVMRPSKNDIKT